MTATLFGISPLVWAVLSLLTCTVAFGLLAGRFIYVASQLGGPEPVRREPESEDLDDWLAQEGPLLEFKVWKRPKASIHINDKGAAGLSIPDATTHGGQIHE